MAVSLCHIRASTARMGFRAGSASGLAAVRRIAFFAGELGIAFPGSGPLQGGHDGRRYDHCDKGETDQKIYHGELSPQVRLKAHNRELSATRDNL